jgi:hypothetical protein
MREKKDNKQNTYCSYHSFDFFFAIVFAHFSEALLKLFGIDVSLEKK